MMRIDKFLSNMGYGTRSEVKKLIKYNTICINDIVCKDPNQKIVEAKDIITINQKVIDYKRFQYFMLNKPKGVITATKDKTQKTVMDLLEKEHLIEYFPVGRLDIDTEGLLLITNDGDMSHRLLSPKKHVDKTYYVECKNDILADDIHKLENGLDIGEKKNTSPAKVVCLDSKRIYLTIQEGKFHQVKRMLQAIQNEVTFLKRIKFGPLELDASLEVGHYRELTKEEEILLLREIDRGE